MQREMESASLAEVTDWSTCVYGKQEFAGAGKTNTGLLSILIGYSFLLPQDAVFNLILLLCVFSAFMFHVFLMLAAAEEFKVSFLCFWPD